MIETAVEYENGGRIDVYRMVDKSAGDFSKLFACCDFFARQGKITLITPNFIVETVGNHLYEKIYASLKGTPYWGKCPDFNVNGLWYEHEGYDTGKDLTDKRNRANSFCWMMRRGVKQSDR